MEGTARVVQGAGHGLFDWKPQALQETYKMLALPHRNRWRVPRSEEHTSELQSRLHLVCRLLLEKKKKPDTGFHGPLSPPRHLSQPYRDVNLTAAVHHRI